MKYLAILKTNDDEVFRETPEMSSEMDAIDWIINNCDLECMNVIRIGRFDSRQITIDEIESRKQVLKIKAEEKKTEELTQSTLHDLMSKLKKSR